MYHLEVGATQSRFQSLIFNYLIQQIYVHSLYNVELLVCKFKANPCVGTDVSSPLYSLHRYHFEFL